MSIIMLKLFGVCVLDIWTVCRGLQGFLRFSTRENARLQRQVQGRQSRVPDGGLKQMAIWEKLAEVRSMKNLHLQNQDCQSRVPDDSLEQIAILISRKMQGAG
ncbi:hypothetical protein SUGI_1016890 [Cryptomeria japonica]|nr:hypothetical protein SUGI_1016890 [Cryptomeria japonica]